MSTPPIPPGFRVVADPVIPDGFRLVSGRTTENRAVRRGLAQGATFGFADEIVGGLIGAAEMVRTLPTRVRGEDVPSFGQVYDAVSSSERAELAKDREESPGTVLASEAIGGAATGLAGASRVLGANALNAMSRPVLGATIGAGEGALYGAGAADPGERVGGAVVGGAIGAVATPVVAGVLDKLAAFGGRFASWAANKLLDTPEDQAKRTLVKAMLGEGLTPDDVVARIRQMGPEATLADVGENFRSVARAAVDTPGPAKANVRTQMNTRQTAQHTRVLGAAQDTIGANADDFHATVRSLTAQRAANAKPVYEKAWQEGIQPSPELDALMARPSLKSALGKANARAAEKGEWTGPLNLLQRLHYAKMELDDRIGALMRSGNTGKARDIIATKNELLALMDSSAPSYGAARAQYAGDTALTNAMELGRNVFKESPDDFLSATARMTQGERDMMRLGVVKAVSEQLDDVRVTHDSVMRLVGKPGQQKKLAEAFKSKADLDEFVSRMGTEAEFTRTRNVLTGGSPTAERLAGQESLKDSIQPDSLLAVARGDPIGLALSVAKEIIGDKPLSPEVLGQFSKALLTKGMSEQEIRKLLSNPRALKSLGWGNIKPPTPAQVRGAIAGSVGAISAQ